MTQRLKNFWKLGFRRVFVCFLTISLSRTRSRLYRLFFSDNTPFLMNTRIIQPTIFMGKGNIKLCRVRLGVWTSPGLISGSGFIEARAEGSSVVIGDSTIINNGFVIIADKSSVVIGKRCLIGPNFFVADSDFHGLEVRDRNNGNYDCLPVVIEDDVFIGEGVKVLKGVKIGRGSVIGMGSVVVKDVEPFSIYAGVPAKKVKSLSST
ncbi:MAG: acyltransferase [Paraglaciecola sp.]|nr:acyltransferase [Paraglaciecola sp.]